MNNALRPALAATFSVSLLFTGPVFASEAQTPAPEESAASQSETAPAPAQTEGRRHRCGGFRAAKNIRTFLTARDETGTTRLERIAATGAGIGITTLAASTVGAVAVATTVAPACLVNVGQCGANIRSQVMAPISRPLTNTAPPMAPATQR